MISELSIEEMEELLRQHAICEMTGDVDATMATLTSSPHYEFAAAGLVAEGFDAVREHYRRALGSGSATGVASKRRSHGAGPNTLFREAWVSFDLPGGERVTGQYLAVYEFDPGSKKIKSRRLFTDRVFDQFMDANLGSDFREVPGVVELKAVTSPVSREEMTVEFPAETASP
ncbi:hypothetical protein GCM10022222_38610 [Amycolatopsis ultiminotia]|uniref:SnoaL-like domain-containing protein n=1 Tax=Amycolatopsis ultiminotia TaxID=543629 RepID=A0ABP6WMN0_9PSEU